MKRSFLIVIFFLFAFLTHGEESRSALLIANGQYKNFSGLANPIPEARSLSEALQKLGFQVTLVENANKEKMMDAISDFETLLKKTGGLAFFHYGGHAVQVEGRNYLIPIDVDIPDERRVATRAVDVDEILGSLQSPQVNTSIVILDSCRNNPLPAGSGRSATRGLSVVNLKPKNSIIIYSAESGTQAIDGLFTPSLVKNISRPGASFTEVIQMVRREVFEASKGAQTPGSYDQLFSPVYLAGKPTIANSADFPEGPVWKWILPDKEIEKKASSLGLHTMAASKLGLLVPQVDGNQLKSFKFWNPINREIKPISIQDVFRQEWNGPAFMVNREMAIMAKSRVLRMESDTKEFGSSWESMTSFNLNIWNSSQKSIQILKISAIANNKESPQMELSQRLGDTERILDTDGKTILETTRLAEEKKKIEDMSQKMITRPYEYFSASSSNRLFLLGIPVPNLVIDTAWPRLYIYDLLKNEIQVDKSPIVVRSGISMIIFKDQLFVVGGGDHSQGRASAEVDVYDISTGKWKSTHLNIPRGDPILVIREGKLYALGGWSEWGKTLTAVEVWNENSGTWQRLKDLDHPVDQRQFLAAGDWLVDLALIPE